MKEMQHEKHEESNSTETTGDSIIKFVKEYADIWNKHNANLLESWV
jgi:hypothetical protein